MSHFEVNYSIVKWAESFLSINGGLLTVWIELQHFRTIYSIYMKVIWKFKSLKVRLCVLGVSALTAIYWCQRATTNENFVDTAHVCLQKGFVNVQATCRQQALIQWFSLFLKSRTTIYTDICTRNTFVFSYV